MILQMLLCRIISKCKHCHRSFSSSFQSYHKVTVLGASSDIGQPLSLLLKQNPNISQLALFDSFGIYGVATDLSHVNSSAKVAAYQNPDEINECLSGSKIVLIPAGVSYTPGMTRDDLFMTNATLLAELSKSCAKYCPEAIICIVSVLVNSMVPMFSKILNKCGINKTNNVIGVTTLNVIRANVYVANAQKLNVKQCNVPVVGGHAENTIVPLISQMSPPVHFHFDQLKAITKKLQKANQGTRSGTRSATLSTAFAAARFTNSLLLAINGVKNIVECAYVKSNIASTPYFSTPLLLGAEGVEKNFGLGSLTAYERFLLDKCLPELTQSIDKGLEFAENYHL